MKTTKKQAFRTFEEPGFLINPDTSNIFVENREANGKQSIRKKCICGEKVEILGPKDGNFFTFCPNCNKTYEYEYTEYMHKKYKLSKILNIYDNILFGLITLDILTRVVLVYFLKWSIPAISIFEPILVFTFITGKGRNVWRIFTTILFIISIIISLILFR